MATITFERNQNTVGSPSWVDIGANRIVFSGSATDLTATIATTAWNDGTHIGSGTPGTDQCGGGPGGGGSHNNNVKYIDVNTMKVNADANEAINDANLAVGECTCRIHLNNAISVATQNTYFFCYNNSIDTVEAVGIESYAFERGVGANSWTLINDDSADIGGNNPGERLDLGEKAAATNHYWFLALAARGESAGAKSAFAFKIVTEIF